MVERILVVEDETTLANNLQIYLSKEGYYTRTAPDCRNALLEIEHDSFDVILVDLKLPDGDGQRLLEKGQSLSPDSVFLIMTAHACLDSALHAFHKGAHDYLIKPFSFQELNQKIANITRCKRVIKENKILRNEIQRGLDREEFLVGDSLAIKQISDMVRKLAPTTSTVLVTGESGTGKELVAHALHAYSCRNDEPFVPLNVAALPEDLIESHLFGHVKGAFTGAAQTREGAFRTANHGTLFLDEIGELSLNAQAKLLRALEDQNIFPVGSDSAIKTDTRVIAATNRNLQECVEQGSFRQDLLYRLNVVNINIPPLRERVEDIPLLVDHLMTIHQQKTGKFVCGTDKEVIHALMGYSWKGNVRELSNVIERAMLLCDADQLNITDLPTEFRSENKTVSTKLTTAVEQFKQQHIVSVLAAVNYNREQAARVLGLSPATLYRQMDKLGLKGFRGAH